MLPTQPHNVEAKPTAIDNQPITLLQLWHSLLAEVCRKNRELQISKLGSHHRVGHVELTVPRCGGSIASSVHSADTPRDDKRDTPVADPQEIAGIEQQSAGVLDPQAPQHLKRASIQTPVQVSRMEDPYRRYFLHVSTIRSLCAARTRGESCVVRAAAVWRDL